MMNAKQISLQIDSRLECVSLIGVCIYTLCREHSMDNLASYQVQTAATEAINNTIIHAYENQPGHSVNVDWIIDHNAIHIEVSDRGKSMDQIPPDIEPQPESENGRGWWIMRRWMDNVYYKSLDGRNFVTMHRKI